MKTSPALSTVLVAVLLVATLSPRAAACTRVVYLGPEDRILTARSMDWKEDIGTNLWVLPRGIERTGEAGPDSVRWVSRYGSVIASAYDIASSDGVNEAGLSANLLWLVESGYPEMQPGRPTIAISLWAQYALDCFATVAEAVEHLSSEPFLVVTSHLPGTSRLATLHLSLSDATGDSAIFEYVEGRLVVHHSRTHQVMTNSPLFDQQLALNEYWRQIGGTVMLPGTNRAADRYARAMFYINAIPRIEDRTQATASVFSVIRNVSVPFGINTPEEPNISSTRWRTVVDHKDRLYYFESAVSPSIFWVDLGKFDFSAGAPVRALRLGPDQSRVLAGEASGFFEESRPFLFQGL